MKGLNGLEATRRINEEFPKVRVVILSMHQNEEYFWQGSELPEGFPGEVGAPPATAALLARLGPFPFWRGRQPLGEALAPVYAAAAARGLDVLLGPAARSGGPGGDRDGR